MERAHWLSEHFYSLITATEREGGGEKEEARTKGQYLSSLKKKLD